jgi:rfaE bifunctional protein kinase chain/domain
MQKSEFVLKESGSASWLDVALTQISRGSVSVFGDFCLDAYWLLDTGAQELSIETGLPVKRVRDQRYTLGGAGNVTANLADLGVQRVQAIGVIGPDLFGKEMLRLLGACGVDVEDSMVVDDQWQTMVYAKPCRGEEEESRIDFGAFNMLQQATVDGLMQALEKACERSEAVILNQQVPGGVSSPAVIERINTIIAKYPKVHFVVDARHRAELYRGATMKVNAQEAARLLGEAEEELAPIERVREYALRIARQTGKPAFITCGDRGIVAADNVDVQQVQGIQVLAKTDPVGAGDTVVSAIAAVLASGQDPFVAARLSNIAASVTVRKLQQTGTATPAEIRSIGPEPDYIYEPDLADSQFRARFLQGTEMEIVGELPGDLNIEHCIFDHDGTLSTLREGWEKIMEPMMVRAILGPKITSASSALLQKVSAEVRSFIDRTTGIQTLVQMKGLVDVVKQAGFVPEEEVLDEHGYKAIFNEELLAMVRRRIDKLQRGELSPEDFQVKNAKALLMELHKRGVKLYLASGTDEVDAISEAKALGYADLFEGRIFGAVGDVNIEAKKLVLERIIREYGLGGHQFATIGDGPVEIREARKRGGFCIGLASDEVRRFGWNFAKRSRLIRAGAQLILPDFSQLPAMLQVMQLA